jgi:hypothetical protein
MKTRIFCPEQPADSKHLPRVSGIILAITHTTSILNDYSSILYHSEAV